MFVCVCLCMRAHMRACVCEISWTASCQFLCPVAFKIYISGLNLFLLFPDFLMAIRHFPLEIWFPIKCKYTNIQQFIFSVSFPSFIIAFEFEVFSFLYCSYQLCYQFNPIDISFHNFKAFWWFLSLPAGTGITSYISFFLLCYFPQNLEVTYWLEYWEEPWFGT